MDSHHAILESLTRLFWHVDHHEWDSLGDVLSDPVRLDYTALQGGEPIELSPGEVAAMSRGALGGLDAHQHLVVNHLITVARKAAEATASFQATHQLDGDTWTLGGDYRWELIRAGSAWRISAMAVIPIWQTGDPTIMTPADERLGS